MGGAVMATYLDDKGNPVGAKPPVYLDDNGESGKGLIRRTAGDFLEGVGAVPYQAFKGAWDLARKIPGASNVIPEPPERLKSLATAPDSGFGKAGEIAGNVALAALPAGAVSRATQGASMLTKMAAQGALGAAQGAVQSGGSGKATALGAFTGAAAEPIAAGISSLMKGGATGLAESATGIRRMDRAYGRTPGKVILEETKGLTPDAVAASAKARMNELEPELVRRATVAKNAGVKGSLRPARDIASARSSEAAAFNSRATPGEMSEISEFLEKPTAGFKGQTEFPQGTASKVSFKRDPFTGKIGAAKEAAPDTAKVVAEEQDPLQLLGMKREFGRDFTSWNPLNPQKNVSVARKVYGALDKEFDKAVPGGAELNQKLSTLIPIANRGSETALNAGLAQNVMHKLGAHNGSLIAPALGLKESGAKGFIGGMMLPEILSTPTVKMAAARGLYGAGKGTARYGVGAAQSAMVPAYRRYGLPEEEE